MNGPDTGPDTAPTTAPGTAIDAGLGGGPSPASEPQGAALLQVHRVLIALGCVTVALSHCAYLLHLVLSAIWPGGDGGVTVADVVYRVTSAVVVPMAASAWLLLCVLSPRRGPLAMTPARWVLVAWVMATQYAEWVVPNEWPGSLASWELQTATQGVMIVVLALLLRAVAARVGIGRERLWADLGVCFAAVQVTLNLLIGIGQFYQLQHGMRLGIGGWAHPLTLVLILVQAGMTVGALIVTRAAVRAAR